MSSAGADPFGWVIEDVRASAAEFHDREPAAGTARVAWWCAVDAPALVIGSAQPLTSVDLGACAAADVPVVRRRSGGGAVLVLPHEIVWLDVVVPRGDPLWDDDVGRSMWWFGDVWASALRTLGVDAVVHRDALVRTPWSASVCFDGVGAGEVLVDGAKAVGVSQRRTRHWARLQSAVHVTWRPEPMIELLAEPRPDARELRPVWAAGPAGVDPDALRTAVVLELGRTTTRR